MSLDSGGRVILKIYDSLGRLLVAKPCLNKESAEKWYEDYPKLEGMRMEVKEIPPAI